MSSARLTIEARPVGMNRAWSGSRRELAAPTALAASLTVLMLLAAFGHGATVDPGEARLQVAVAAVTALAGVAVLWSGTLRLRAPRAAQAGIALLGLLSVWHGVSLAWSVEPNATWLETNRVVTYLLVLVLGVTLGASHPRAIQLIARAFLVIAMAVALYALGQKLLPGLHIPGVFDLNQTGPLPRLQEPFGYWNALALFLALGVPVALALASDRERSPRIRILSAISLQLLFVTIAFTYSRGSPLALALVLIPGLALSRAPLRSLLWLAVTVVAALPPTVFGLTAHSLTTANIGAGDREAAGALLTGILLVSLLGLAGLARLILEREVRVVITPARARRISRGLGVSAGLALLLALLTLTFSSRGLPGTFSHAWSSFTATQSTSVYDPHRLLSVDSENRWVWWKEAAGAFSDRPLAGWGAGAFPVVHLLYRRDPLTVRQPHSLPLQWLAEDGVVGAVLGLGALALLLVAAVGLVRRLPRGSERLLTSALAASAFVYLLHSFYDWDWDIPGVTLPAMVFLGVLAGTAGRHEGQRGQPVNPPGRGIRTLAIAAATLALCLFSLSAALPSLSASQSSSAVLSASAGSAAAAQAGLSQANTAARLDPLSDAAPQAEASIASGRGRLGLGRAYYLQAVRREPNDPQPWIQLASLDFYLGRQREAIRAAERAMALDPARHTPGRRTGLLSARVNLQISPPSDSATATPLGATR